MEPESEPLEEEYEKPSFSGSMLVFGGVGIQAGHPRKD